MVISRGRTPQDSCLVFAQTCYSCASSRPVIPPPFSVLHRSASVVTPVLPHRQCLQPCGRSALSPYSYSFTLVLLTSARGTGNWVFIKESTSATAQRRANDMQ